MFNNYFRPTPKRLIKMSLALKAFIGSLSGACYVHGNTRLGFWLLVAGAVIDFFIQCSGDDDTNAGQTTKAVVVAFLLSALCLSCNPVKKVLRDPGKLEQVGRQWEKSNPCVNDTVTVKAGRDTVWTISGDTVLLPDTLVTFHNDTIVRTVFVPKIIQRIGYITDTVTNNITDERRLRIANDSVWYYRIQLRVFTEHVRLLQAEHENPAIMARYLVTALLRKWWFWLLVAGGFGFLYIRSKTSIFK